MCYSVFYCKVSPIHSGNCHFKQKQKKKIVHSSNKKTRISISLKYSQGSDRGETDLYVQEKPSVCVWITGQAAASVMQGSAKFPRDSHLGELKLLRCKLSRGLHGITRNVCQFFKQILKKEPNPKQASTHLQNPNGQMPNLPPYVTKANSGVYRKILHIPVPTEESSKFGRYTNEIMNSC